MINNAFYSHKDGTQEGSYASYKILQSSHNDGQAHGRQAHLDYIL